MPGLNIELRESSLGFINKTRTTHHSFYRKWEKCMTPHPVYRNKALLIACETFTMDDNQTKLKSEEVVRAFITRIQEIQPIINAVVDTRYDEALKEAKDVDKFIASGEKSEEAIARDTPFLGVPCTVKECIGVKGLYQTGADPNSKGRRADEDPVVVKLYRQSGLIPLVVTNTPEMCMWWETSNHMYGLTKNPYDFVRTVGGSSGGEAALITSGGPVLGIGSDVGGSIRIPASFCGIYGHKPTSGVISNKGSYPEIEEMDVYLSTGPMCRYVEDLLPIMKVSIGNDKRVNLDQSVDFRNLNVYYMEGKSTFLTPSYPKIKNAVKKAAHHFRDKYGSQVVKVNLEEMNNSHTIWESKFLEAIPISLKSAMEGNKKLNLFWELVKNALGCSEHTIPALYFAITERRTKDKVYYKALEEFKSLERKLQIIFEDNHSVFLFPTHPEPPPHINTAVFKFPNSSYTSIFNVLGLPVTQIPAGFCNNLPIGIQAVSGKFQDHLTIRVANELDKVYKGWTSPTEIKA